jgi:hypothetical protein
MLVFVVVLIVTILIVFHKKLTSSKQIKRSIDESILVKNKQKYASHMEVLTLYAILYMILIIIVVYVVGNFIQAFIQPSEKALFYFQGDKIIWMLFGMAFASGLVFTALDFMSKRKFKDEYPVYLEWIERKHRGIQIVTKLLTILCISSGLSMAILYLDTSLTVTEEKVLVNSFLDLGDHEYLTKDLSHIIHYTHFTAPNGNILPDEHYALYVKGAEIWNSNDLAYRGKLNEYTDMIEFLQSKSGLSITEGGVHKEE